MTLLFLEISDKMPSVSGMYTSFFIFGIIGMALGYWRWLLGLVWLLVPQLFITAGFLLLQTDDIDSLYRHVIREFGPIYIWHTWAAPLSGLVLTMVGIMSGFWRVRIRLK